MKVLIVGAGKLGFKVATYLAMEENAQVAVVDKNQEVLDRLSDYADVMTIKANGIHISDLREIGVNEYDLCIACTGDDETNIICSTILKRIGCKRVIARIRNPEYVEHKEFIKETMDIDLVLNPEMSTAKAISNYLLKNYSFNTNNFALSRVSVFDIPISDAPNMIGKKIKDIKELTEFVVVAIFRNGEATIPNGDSIIEKEDTIYVMGKTQNLDEFVCKTNKHICKNMIKTATIVGGGRVGYYLAKRLALKGLDIKLIEKDQAKCDFLSENLPNNVLVLNGDGSDIKLLQEEDIASSDAFIGATGYDEENLLISLVLKKMGLKKCVAKVSRSNYISIIETLGVDATFSTVDITASEILKFFRGGKVLSVSLLLGGKAEVNEFVADKSMKIVGKPLSQLDLPKGVIIGAILTTKNEVIIPNGDTVINSGDRFVVFSLAATLQKLNPFINNKF